MKHKYAEILTAIAEGKEVEIEGARIPNSTYYTDFSVDTFLTLCNGSTWTFRLKPEPKPDVVSYLIHSSDKYHWLEYSFSDAKNIIKLTRSGETGELIGAEILK